MHMHLSKDICHLITRFQLQTKSHVFSSVLKAPDIFICQCYFAINFVKYEEKKRCRTKTKKDLWSWVFSRLLNNEGIRILSLQKEGLRWGCICHGKERKHGRAGIGVGIDILPLEVWEFWTGWLQKIPPPLVCKFLQQFSIPLPPFIAHTTS